jgi:hypothetical protein
LAESAQLAILSLNYPRGNVNSGIHFGYANANYIQAADDSGANSKQLTLNPFGGNVGIGTTAPAAKLEVGKNEAVSHQVRITSGVWNEPTIFFNSYSNYNYTLGNFGTSGSKKFQLKTNNGSVVLSTGGNDSTNVGIGTATPGVLLDIDSTAQNVFRLDTTNSDGPLQIFRNNGTVRGYIGNAEGVLGQGVSNFGIRAQADLYFGSGGNNTRLVLMSNGGITTPKGGAHNVHLGEDALYSVGSNANYNTAIGRDALKANATGSNGVAIGYEALMSDGSVEESTAVGAMALRSQTSGRNHAFGFKALVDLQGGVYNTAVGGETLENVVNGGYNTAVGTFAGRLNQNGDQNTYIGYQSGYTNNGGDGNVALGHKAFYGSTTANNCIAIGRDSMGSAVSGDFNISIGRTSSNSMTSGTQNTSIGVDSLTSMSTGSYNVAVGPSALRLGTGAMSNNTAVGYQSGRNTTSNNNVFLGYESGYSNTSGINTGIGHRALRSNQTGTGNVAVGNDVMYYNNGGSYNTAVGHGAHENSGNSSYNVAIGYQALYNNDQSWGENVAIGYHAGYSIEAGYENITIGRNAGYGLTSGYRNTFIGDGAGNLVTTGHSNTVVGRCRGQDDGMDIRTTSGNAIISNGTGTPLIHTVVSSTHLAGNVDVTQNLSTGNHITIAQGAVVNLFGSGNAFSGVFIINDFTSSGRIAMVMTGGNMINIIYQSAGGSVFTTSSSPASGEIGIYLSSLGVKVKNNRGASLNIRVLSFRTRNQQ